jgi:hypothetical protein
LEPDLFNRATEAGELGFFLFGFIRWRLGFGAFEPFLVEFGKALERDPETEEPGSQEASDGDDEHGIFPPAKGVRVSPIRSIGSRTKSLTWDSAGDSGLAFGKGRSNFVPGRTGGWKMPKKILQARGI